MTAGNRTTLTASVPGAATSYSGTTGYQYDYNQTANPALNRSQLTQETSTRGSYTNTFAYDAGTSTGPGNPTSFKGTSQTFNVDNQLTGVGMAYDGAGNPTTYKAKALTFDPENRLTSYGGTVQTNGYSGDGLRAWKQAGSTRTYFLYDGAAPVCEYNASGTLTATNTFGADGLVSRRAVSSNVTTFYTFDERGSVSQRLSTAGAVLSSDLYDGFGTRSSTGAADVWGFEAQAGYYTDSETGLILCTHRFYDPQSGRWLTRDPMGYEGGVNLYGYVGNDPVNADDPDGTHSTVIEPPTVTDVRPPIPGGGGLRVGAGPGAIISAGVLAGIDLGTYKVGHPQGPFTTFGEWIADKLSPPSDGLPAPPQNGRKPTRKSGKDKASDVASWTRYCEPKRDNETCHEWATRELDKKYGRGNWRKGEGSEYSGMVKSCMRGGYSWSK